MIFNRLKWKYPSKGELPQTNFVCIQIPVIAHLIDDEGLEKYCILLWDDVLKGWEDPETGEVNENTTCVNRWEYLGKVVKQIKK